MARRLAAPAHVVVRREILLLALRLLAVAVEELLERRVRRARRAELHSVFADTRCLFQYRWLQDGLPCILLGGVNQCDCVLAVRQRLLIEIHPFRQAD